MQSEDRLQRVFENNMTANIIMGNKDQTMRLKETEVRSKFNTKYANRR
jgi:hypothetical protein